MRRGKLDPHVEKKWKREWKSNRGEVDSRAERRQKGEEKPNK
jgi:hypothetical protein